MRRITEAAGKNTGLICSDSAPHLHKCDSTMHIIHCPSGKISASALSPFTHTATDVKRTSVRLVLY